METMSLLCLWTTCLLAHGSLALGPASVATSHPVVASPIESTTLCQDGDLRNLQAWGLLTACPSEGDPTDGESFDACGLTGLISFRELGQGSLALSLLVHRPTSPFTARSPVLRC